MAQEARWIVAVLALFGESLERVRTSRITFGGVFLALTTADRAVLDSLGVATDGQELHAMTQADACARIVRDFPNAADVMGYAINPKNMKDLAVQYQAFMKNGGVRRGEHIVAAEDIAVLDLSPEVGAALAKAMESGDVKTKSVAKQVRRVRADASQKEAAQQVVQGWLKQAEPTLDEQIEQAEKRVERARTALTTAENELAELKTRREHQRDAGTQEPAAATAS